MITEELRAKVFAKTGGECYYCGKKLCFNMRDRYGRGSWEVEHLVARHNGGWDHLNNLVPACWECNLDKGVGPSRRQRLAVVSDREARAARRMWRTADIAALPGIAVAKAVWDYMKATGPTEAQQAMMTEDERNHHFWKMLLVPALAGLATMVIIVMLAEATRKA